jgi:hypothetical protein
MEMRREEKVSDRAKLMLVSLKTNQSSCRAKQACAKKCSCYLCTVHVVVKNNGSAVDHVHLV